MRLVPCSRSQSATAKKEEEEEEEDEEDAESGSVPAAFVSPVCRQEQK